MPIESPPTPPMQNFALSAAFGRNSNVKLRPPIRGLGWTRGVQNDNNWNVVPTFHFYFYTHYRPILHRLATIHNVAERQSDWNSLKTRSPPPVGNSTCSKRQAALKAAKHLKALIREAYIIFCMSTCQVKIWPRAWGQQQTLVGDMSRRNCRLRFIVTNDTVRVIKICISISSSISH